MLVRILGPSDQQPRTNEGNAPSPDGHQPIVLVGENRPEPGWIYPFYPVEIKRSIRRKKGTDRDRTYCRVQYDKARCLVKWAIAIGNEQLSGTDL